MRLSLLFVLVSPFGPGLELLAQDSDNAVHLHVADGQLRSHVFVVHVTHAIADSMNPRLILQANHAITERQPGEGERICPLFVALNQEWEEVRAGTKVSQRGTLMIFDLSKLPFHWYKPMARFTPILQWDEDGTEGTRQAAIGENQVYVGNIVAAGVWTVALVLVLLAIVIFFARGHVVMLICGADGYLSLSRVQFALWVIAIGSVVAMFGLMKLEVPDLPNSLMALMGLSSVTGAVSYFQATKGDGQAQADTDPIVPKPSDLVRGAPAGEPSIAKAQMLFWTGLVLVIFVVKSIIDGVIWEVPWEMVALMGISQAGYLGPKVHRAPDFFGQ